MATVIRRKRMAKGSLGPYKRHELLTGEIKYALSGYTGYGDGHGTDLTKFISDAMRSDWQAHRNELLAFWKSGEHTKQAIFPDSVPWLFVRGNDFSLPWAAEQFDR
jgi:hypothetical protein